MSERREEHQAGIAEAGATEMAGDVTEAIRRLVAAGYIVTIGPTAGGLFPYHLIVYHLSEDALIDQRCRDFVPKLLDAANQCPNGR